MNIIYRKAALNDLKSIQKLNFELCKKEFKEFDNTINYKYALQKKGADYFKKRITRKDGFAFVALDENKIIGYIVGGIADIEDYRNIKKLGEAENMIIDESYRGKGIGSMLFKEFIAWCKSKKIHRVKVVISATNKKSIDFHKKMGFSDYNVTLEKII